MRAWPLLAPLALAFATPALAQNADDDIWDNDPYAHQDEAVIAVDRIMDTLLDLPVGRLASAMPDVEVEGDVRPDDTLRDMMVRDNPGAEEDLRGKARMATAMIGTMLSEIETMLPELERWGESLGRSLPE
ncbi:hypothetical protein HFP57_07900 [Parasphingopyxis algicola]|uniref:hypothetical protein n=1 Tax=Parasphingopyxis algicola TaxID=2026624 RepID=UPI0015A0A10F|nr:hypothetical protein [Parasphingopyxis algicola]QLC24958.1 hypothetical protein HFP57_07900 [Parasphingopyxis algicola]